MTNARPDDFAIVWWVRAEDSALLTSDLAELAPHLGIPSLDDPSTSLGRRSGRRSRAEGEVARGGQRGSGLGRLWG